MYSFNGRIEKFPPFYEKDDDSSFWQLETIDLYPTKRQRLAVQRKKKEGNLFMKTKTIVSLLLALSLVSASAFAKTSTAKRDTASTTESVTTTTTVHESRSTRSAEFGMGGTTMAMGGNATGISGMLDLNDIHSLQFTAAIRQVRPSFQFGVGTYYRATVAGNTAAGFHVGAGATLGTGFIGNDAAFCAAISPIAGVHFEAVRNIKFSFDGGMNLDIYDGNVAFGVGGTGPLLGASVHYMF